MTNQRGDHWQLIRDAAGRLVEERDYWGKSRTYHYDEAGNRFVESTDPDGGREFKFANGISYRLDEAGQVNLRYNAEHSARLEWDENECLARYTSNDGSGEAYEYHYDALRRRISKARRNRLGDVVELTCFMWDGDAMVAEVKVPVKYTAESWLEANFYVYYQDTFEPLILQSKAQGIGSLAPPNDTGYYFYQNDPNLRAF